MTPERPSDPPPRTVDTDAGPVCVTDVGEGPAVVAVHGLPGSVRDFRWLGAALEPHLRLVRVDLPGFGATPRASGPSASLAARGDLVARVADALQLDRYVILGHSMGGAVAAATAARHPDRVRGLALVASVGRRPHRALRAQPVPMGVLSLGLRVGPLRRRLLPRIRASFERAGFRGHPDEALVHTVHLVAGTSFADHGRHLAAVRAPTFLAWARDDEAVEDAIGEDLYWACTSGPRVVFPSGGHNLQKSRAVELSEALRAWVATL